MSTLTDRIRAAREKAGLSQTDVAKALGISASAVNQWEHGFSKNIKLQHFFALARLLGQDPQWLANRQGTLPSARDLIDAAGAGLSLPHQRGKSAALLCSPNAQRATKSGAEISESAEQHLHFS